jgi:hypothetical protein
MPIHLPQTGDFQVVAVFSLVVLGALCARYWRATLAVAAAVLIVAGLIALNVVLDLRVLHQLAGYLHDIRQVFG